MLDLEEKYDLTNGETVSIVGNFLAMRAKYMIRNERHPKHPNKKGDEA